MAGKDGGGVPASAIKLFTGSDTTVTLIGKSSSAEVAQKLQAAISAHKAIASGIYGDGASQKGPQPAVTADQFYKQHEYSIIGFTPDGKGGGTVEVRNPWGVKMVPPTAIYRSHWMNICETVLLFPYKIEAIAPR
jgi:hypothetical protein